MAFMCQLGRLTFSRVFACSPSIQCSATSGSLLKYLWLQRQWFAESSVICDPISRSHRESSKDTFFNTYRPRAALEVEIEHYPDGLKSLLDILHDAQLNVTQIESKPVPFSATKQIVCLHIGDEWNSKEVQTAVECIEKELHVKPKQLKPLPVKWFPQSILDIDHISRSFISDEEALAPDSPGFNDLTYIARRKEIGSAALNYSVGRELPIVKYSENENNTWNVVFSKLSNLFEKHACEEFLEVFEDLKEKKIYTAERLPYLRDVSEFLTKRTGFSIYPVAGFLTSRDFLNALAFRVFFSTQYIRHHSVPFYTPEPDIIHELIGHAPMLGNKMYADFSQLIGLTSIGASDEQIKMLAACYWYTAEFGVLQKGEELRGYGAGVLSSVNELINATVPEKSISEVRHWDPADAAARPFPITVLQPLYYAGSSLEEIFEKMFDFCRTFSKPFSLRYSEKDRSVYPDTLVIPKPSN